MDRIGGLRLKLGHRKWSTLLVHIRFFVDHYVDHVDQH
jgi:hypothetical protein